MGRYVVTWPDAEYHEILPNLYQGGHLWRDNALQNRDSRNSTISEDLSWDYVVSSYVSQQEASWPQCDQRFVIFDDTEDGLEEEVWIRIRSAVDQIVSRLHLGQKVLVRCQAGYNRSGMIMALVLMRLGFTAEAAIAMLRTHRGVDVLANKVFEGYVREREEEYFNTEIAETRMVIT